MGEDRELFFFFFLVFAVSQLSLAQHNLYAKVAYFGVTYSDSLQYQRICGHVLKLSYLSSAARQLSCLSPYVSGSSLSMSFCGSVYYSCSLNAGFLGSTLPE